MSAIILGLPNHTAQDYTTVTSIGSTPADMVPSWLKTEEPTDISRITSLDPALTQWLFAHSLLALTIDGFAVENHNLSLGSQIRFVADTQFNAGVTPVKTQPSSIIASTNLTGAITTVDEDPSSPDGLVMEPTVQSSAWSVTIKTTNLSGAVDTGSDKVAVVIRVRRMFVGAGATLPVTLPKVTVTIPAAAATGGVPIVLGYRAITNTDAGGQFLIFPCSRGDFASATNVQVQFDFTTGLSNSGSQYAVMDTTSIYYETISLATPFYDSGWLNIPGDSRPAPLQPTRRYHYFPENPWTGVYVYAVMVRSDQTQHDPPTDNLGRPPVSAIVTPTTFVQAGVVCAGESLEIDWALSSPGSVVAVAEVGAESIAGKTYSADAFRRVVFDEPIELVVSRDQLLVLQDQLAFRRGRSGAFYVALEPNVEMKYQLFTSGWVVCTGVSQPKQYGTYYPDERQQYIVSIRLEQKL